MKKVIISFLTLSLVTTHLAFGILTKEDGRQKRRKKIYHKAILSLNDAKKQKGHYQNKKVKRITKQCNQLKSQIKKANRNNVHYEQDYNEDS